MNYQVPEMIEIGSFAELTLGDHLNNIADENSYRCTQEGGKIPASFRKLIAEPTSLCSFLWDD